MLIDWLIDRLIDWFVGKFFQKSVKKGEIEQQTHDLDIDIGTLTDNQLNNHRLCFLSNWLIDWLCIKNCCSRFLQDLQLGIVYNNGG